MSTEANTCVTCGENRGAIETLFGKVCAECDGSAPVEEKPAQQYPFPIGPQLPHLPHPAEESGPVILTKKPLDL